VKSNGVYKYFNFELSIMDLIELACIGKNSSAYTLDKHAKLFKANLQYILIQLWKEGSAELWKYNKSKIWKENGRPNIGLDIHTDFK